MGKNTKKINEIKNLLLSRGWEEDRWGNFKKIKDDKEYRYKFQAISLRHESSYRVGKEKKWICIRSIYYKDIDLQHTNFITKK